MFGVEAGFEDVVVLEEVVRKVCAKGVPEGVFGYVGGGGDGFQQAVIDGGTRER